MDPPERFSTNGDAVRTKASGDVVGFVGEARHQLMHVKNVLKGDRGPAWPEAVSYPVLGDIRIEDLPEFPRFGIKAGPASQQIGDLRLRQGIPLQCRGAVNGGPPPRRHIIDRRAQGVRRSPRGWPPYATPGCMAPQDHCSVTNPLLASTIGNT